MQEGRALTGLAQVYQAQGRLKLAIECAETAVDVYADIGWKIQQARAYRLTGQLPNTAGRHTQAVQAWHRAVAAFYQAEAQDEAAELTALLYA